MAMLVHIRLHEATFWYSGAEGAYRSFEPVLKALGTPVYLDEDPVSAGLQEVILITTMYGLLHGFLQSMALLKTAKQHRNGGAQRFTKEVMNSFIVALCRICEDLARQIDNKDYVTKGEGARLGQQVVALDDMMLTCEEQGLSAELVAPMRKLVQDSCAQGGSEEELSALVEVIADRGRQ